MGSQAVVQQQVSSIGEGQLAVGRRGRAQRLAQALQGTAAIAFGPPEQSCLIVDLPAGDSGLYIQTNIC